MRVKTGFNFLIGSLATLMMVSSCGEANAQVLEKMKENWKASERMCRECGKTIHGREVCATCLAKKASDKVKEVEQNMRRTCQSCGKTIHGRDTCTTCWTKAANEKTKFTNPTGK